MSPRGKVEWQRMVHKANLEESLHSPPSNTTPWQSSVIVDQSGIDQCRQLKTHIQIHTYIPMTNAFATIPDVEMPLKNLRTMYTYMSGEKAFPTLNTIKAKIESRTTKRRPNLQRAGGWDRIKSKIHHLQSAAIPALGLSGDTFTGAWSSPNSTRRRRWVKPSSWSSDWVLQTG